MGTCLTVDHDAPGQASEDEYHLLVKAYGHSIKNLYIPEIVLSLIKSYLPKPHWGAIYGGYGGGHFDSLKLNGYINKITGIRLYGGSYVDSIRFQINGEWKSKYGGNGGGKQELILKQNEHFSKIEIRSGKYIDNLKLYTNLGRWIQVGGTGGGYHQEGDNQSVLIDCKGRSGAYIDQLQFLWL